MIEMGSLFIPTALVLLGAAATSSDFISTTARIALAASAPTLYILWLFLVQLSTRLMDDVDSDMRLYLSDGAARVLHLFYQDRHGFGRMMWLRRNHWLAYVPLLTVGASFIIASIILKVQCRFPA
jgi:general stress protein CsbA